MNGSGDLPFIDAVASTLLHAGAKKVPDLQLLPPEQHVLMVPMLWQRRPAYAPGISVAISPNGLNGIGDLLLHFRMAIELLRRRDGACKSTAATPTSPGNIIARLPPAHLAHKPTNHHLHVIHLFPQTVRQAKHVFARPHLLLAAVYLL